MSKIDDGGCVSPNMITCGNGIEMSGGLSLRDYFAAAALTGIIANQRFDETVTFATTAKHAFLTADAMLAARREGA